MPVKISKPAAAKIKQLKRYRTTLDHVAGKGFVVKARRGLRKRPNRVLHVTTRAKQAMGQRIVSVTLDKAQRHFLAHVVSRPKPTMRQLIVQAARWGVEHKGEIHYSEGAIRSQALTKPFGALPLTTDCSGFATYCYKHAGAPDPNGLGYRQLGYTGTMLDHASKGVGCEILTDISKALPGDLIVYGPGTGEHVAIIVEAGKDPLTVSHGDEAAPELIHVSGDGRMPQRICRYLPA